MRPDPPSCKAHTGHAPGIAAPGRGQIPCFNECFIGDGNVNTLEVVRTLREVGFTGFMIPDHVPATDGDSSWHHRGRAHAVGYMKALLQVVEQL